MVKQVDENGDALTSKQVCERLRIHRNTFYREVERGHLKVFKVGAHMRVRRSDLDAYMQNAQEVLA